MSRIGVAARGLALAVLLGALVPRTGHATAGEREWSLGGVVAFDPAGAALGIDASFLYDVTDFWAGGVALRDRRVVARMPEGLTAATADVRFVIDALTWIPALSIGVGPAWASGPGWTAYGRAEAALGYRPARDWGLVARLAAEQAGVTAMQPAVTFGLAFVWYRGAGGALDL